VIIDRFGEEVHTEVIDGDWFRAKAEVLVSPMFFGWLLQFTGRMVLESPKEVVNAYHKTLENARDSLL
jgi:predicted metal-dependent hydrolase